MLHSLLAAAQTRLGLEDHPWLDDAVERAAVFGEADGAPEAAGWLQRRGCTSRRRRLPPLPPTALALLLLAHGLFAQRLPPRCLQPWPS